jgi:hypothetical protein
MKQSIIDRFKTKYTINELTDCHEWHGRPNDYGRFWYDGKLIGAHRFAYILANGEIPHHESYHGIEVCHTCDNRRCVNPEHLFLGTHKANMHDMCHKGRQLYPRWNKKITQEQADTIIQRRASGEKCGLLAIEYNVTHSLISMITNGKWYPVF